MGRARGWVGVGRVHFHDLTYCNAATTLDASDAIMQCDKRQKNVLRTSSHRFCRVVLLASGVELPCPKSIC